MKRQKINRIQHSKSTLDKKSVGWLIFCGSLIGIVNGFFGGGGGMLCVPLLERVLQLDEKYAHATAIVVILPISFVSAVIYCWSETLSFALFVPIVVGSVLGGIVGAFLLKFLPEKLVKFVFVVVMFLGGLRLIF